jgi:hypothetical protein
MRVTVICLAILFAATTSAQASGNCAALAAKQTAVSRATDAALVARLGKQSVAAKDIGPVMFEGQWRLVWATPADAERGVYFFRRSDKGNLRLIGTWGGVLAPGERSEGIRWAQKLRGGGPSVRLAGCFADAVLAGN